MQNQTTNEGVSRVCREYRESGLSQKDFCERHGVSRSTLSYRLKKEREQAETQTLVQVASKPMSTPSGALRVRIGSRVVIELERPVDIGELKRVLAAVSEL